MQERVQDVQMSSVPVITLPLGQVGMFVQQGVGVKPVYDRAVSQFYRSEVTEVDFGASGSGTVVQTVNSWASRVTEGKVNQLLETDPGSDTRLLVVGAAQLQPRWLYPFDPEQTSYNGQFWLADGVTR